ncbi:unnamed protein product [Bursaphelenchus xylophilus]|uniref:(pine wood nematode) hypothetical protein n=1 Tax=Bursaphelenchus xylophilus TaxID=6326 RepID=A0A1I7SAU5_BURXY|nr:unnamed protein product [Bursaphelenchus xylophilus]CAG9126759.1 unnamed protein product [Bursaphelenchus xylophilus]
MVRTVLVGFFVAAAVLASPIDLSVQDGNGLNIPDPVEVDKSNEKAFEAYDFFKTSLAKSGSLKASPCDDFYNYTCQNMDLSNYLVGMDVQNSEYVIRGLKKERDIQWFKTIKKEFDACVKRQSSRLSMHQNGAVLRKIFDKVNMEFGPSFPLLEKIDPAAIDSSVIGDFVGFLAQKFRLHTFLAYEIEGGRILLDEPKLAFPESYFTEAFGEFEAGYKASMRDYLTQLSQALKKPIDTVTMNKVIDEVVEFERGLAQALSQIPQEVSSLVGAAELNSNGKAINVNAYLARITKNAKRSDLLSAHNVQLNLAAPTKMDVLQAYVAQANPETVMNYLSIRLIRSLRKYFVKKPVESVADQWLREQRGVKVMGVFPPQPVEDEFGDGTPAERSCASSLSYRYLNQIDRIYLDEQLPDLNDRKAFVNRIAVITNKIINGFRFQVDQLSWFSPKVKEAAYKKIDAMLFNVVYDDWIENDDILNERTRLVDDIDENDDDFTANEKMDDFAQALEWEGLVGGGRDQNFSRSIRTVNAWYNFRLNHFYIPLGILQRPIFDVNFPAALHYSSVGYIVGHELTHGFDSNGVNYDDQGNPNPWMDASSKANFNEMAKCVIDEYTRLHKRGRMTQTEDIADNGGLRASWNAYKAEQGLYGSDPQLPSSPSNKYTQDQIFFLGFAHVWCSNKPKQDYGFDPHSPLLYRVWGTLQNFPAFQAAYNCPVGSAYAPKEHCDVWASEVKI